MTPVRAAEPDNGTVTICLYDLGLSRLGFELPTFRMRGERSNRLRHRRGFVTCDWLSYNHGFV